jgi:hypothetical protein
MQNVCLADSPINSDLLCRYVAHDNSNLAALIRIVGRATTIFATRHELAQAAGLTFEQTKDALVKLRMLPGFQTKQVPDGERSCLQVRVIERLLPTMPESIDWTKHKKAAPWKRPYKKRKPKPHKSVRLPVAKGLPAEDKDQRDLLRAYALKKPTGLRYDMRDALWRGDPSEASLILSVLVRKLPLKQVRGALDAKHDWLLDPDLVMARSEVTEALVVATRPVLATKIVKLPDGMERRFPPQLGALVDALKRQIGVPVKNGTTPL